MTRTSSPLPLAADANVEAAEAEHRALKRLLGTLGRASDLPGIRETVVTLSRLLPAHFTAEEAEDGLFEELMRLHPAHEARIRPLIVEHGALGEELAALLSRVDAVAEAMDALQDAKAVFIQRVIDHEAAERALIMDAYYVDLGDAD